MVSVHTVPFPVKKNCALNSSSSSSFPKGNLRGKIVTFFVMFDPLRIQKAHGCSLCSKYELHISFILVRLLMIGLLYINYYSTYN